MESIGGVLGRISVDGLRTQVEDAAKKLLKDPLVVQWRAEHADVSDDELKPHLNKLYQYVSEARNCADCPGLDRCPNDFPGHYTVLSLERWNGRAYVHDRKAACAKYAAHEANEALKRRIRSFYVDAQMFQRGYDIDEMIGIDRERAIAVERLIDYITLTQSEGLQKKGLYLVGPFGTGKTYLIGYLLHELAKCGYSGVIVYMPEFMEELKNMIAEPARMAETIALLKETDLLVFDDIGAEHVNAWARDHVIGPILNYRMNRKPTFYTSNHPLESLEKHFSFTSKDGEEAHKGKRLMERIAPYVDVVVVGGRNKRGDTAAAY